MLPPTVPPLPRRRVLGGALALPLLGACEVAGGLPTAAPEPPDPDAAALQQALAVEERLLAAYDAALAAPPTGPALAARLAAVRAEHAVHAEALRALGAEGAAPSATGASPAGAPPAQPPGAGAPGGAASPAVPAPASPGDPAAVRAGLVTAERSAQALHARLAATATPRTAPVLASLSAAEAAHLVVLTLP